MKGASILDRSGLGKSFVASPPPETIPHSTPDFAVFLVRESWALDGIEKSLLAAAMSGDTSLSDVVGVDGR